MTHRMALPVRRPGAPDRSGLTRCSDLADSASSDAMSRSAVRTASCNASSLARSATRVER